MFRTIFLICLSYFSYALAALCTETAMKPTIWIGTTSYPHGAQFQVQEGKELLARCEHSEAKKLNITFGPSGNIFNSNYAFDSVVGLPAVSVDRTMAGLQCSCSALQLSGCYTETIITLDVTYPPEITLLTANNQTTSVVVNLTDPLHFICTATGNPIPRLYMTHETPTATPWVTAATNTLDHTIQAGCSDTDLFYCVSNNNINTGSLASKQKSIQVYVRCAPKVVATTDSYPVKLGSTAEVRIPITAYPNPNNFTLYSPTSTFDKPVDSSKYNISFLPGTAPKGTIVVYIYSTTREDLTQYILDLHNGVSGVQPYSFRLTEKKDDLTVGEIVGIAVGVTAAVVIIIVVIVVIICKQKKSRSPIRSKETEDEYDKVAYHYSSPYIIGYERPALAPPCEYVDVEEQYDTIPADVVRVDDIYVGDKPIDNPDYTQPLPDPHSLTYGGSVYSQATDANVLSEVGPYPSTYGSSVYSQATDISVLPGDSNNYFSISLPY